MDNHLPFDVSMPAGSDSGTASLAWWLRRPPRERQDPGRVESSHTSDLQIGRAPGVIESALGLVGPVSVYCDWVRWKVWLATSISVWQQIRPWDTPARCLDVKQQLSKLRVRRKHLPTNTSFLVINLRLTQGSDVNSMIFYELSPFDASTRP